MVPQSKQEAQVSLYRSPGSPCILGLQVLALKPMLNFGLLVLDISCKQDTISIDGSKDKFQSFFPLNYVYLWIQSAWTSWTPEALFV